VDNLTGFDNTFLGLMGDIGQIRSSISKTDVSIGSMPLRLTEGFAYAFNYKLHVWKLWLGPVPHAFLMSPEGAEAILSNNQEVSKGMHYNFIKPWLGLGLLISNGDKWRRMRKLLTPAFHFKILQDFLPIMNTNGKVLVDKLETISQQNQGLIQDLRPLIIACTLDVICETAMGVQLNAQKDPDSKYVKAVHTTGEIVMDRVFKPWLWSDFIFGFTKEGKLFEESLKIMHAFTDDVIKKRKTEIEHKFLDMNSNKSNNNKDFNDVKKREPFMDTLIQEHIQNPKDMSLVNVREEVDTFMFEGHDTTAWGVIWSTFLLGLNPHCQEKVHAEVDAAYDGKYEGEDLTLDDLKLKLPYIEAVVKEAQRLFPSVPAFSRVLESDLKVEDLVVPAGVNVVLFPRVIHRNPNHWPEPEKFIPERFLSHSKRHPYAFIPFSAGSRNCIGQKFAIMEEKALLAKIFRRFSVTSLDHVDKVNITSSLILKATDPLRVRLQVRKTTD
jgi:cytochrome P450